MGQGGHRRARWVCRWDARAGGRWEKCCGAGASAAAALGSWRRDARQGMGGRWCVTCQLPLLQLQITRGCLAASATRQSRAPAPPALHSRQPSHQRAGTPLHTSTRNLHHPCISSTSARAHQLLLPSPASSSTLMCGTCRRPTPAHRVTRTRAHNGG